MSITDKETEFLYARLSDMEKDADKGIFRVSGFFSLAQLCKVKRWLASEGGRANVRIYGGYENAERARVYFFPDYMAGEGSSPSVLLGDYGYEDPTAVLKISASGFRALTHRDFMGSILSLGIERDVIGDIVVTDEYTAYVFCCRTISDFIISGLKKVANDAVKVEECEAPGGEFGERKFEQIRDTVASCRLDAVVAAVCNLSRDAAKKLVCSGICELNYEQCGTPDTELKLGDVFSVRGKGKYKLHSLDGENARGRLRITVHKYI